MLTGKKKRRLVAGDYALDEPMDGFSHEQTFRLRDILKELDCEQVITVSHETELEDFVDKICELTKKNGELKITVA